MKIWNRVFIRLALGSLIRRLEREYRRLKKQDSISRADKFIFYSRHVNVLENLAIGLGMERLYNYIRRRWKEIDEKVSELAS